MSWYGLICTIAIGTVLIVLDGWLASIQGRNFMWKLKKENRNGEHRKAIESALDTHAEREARYKAIYAAAHAPAHGASATRNSPKPVDDRLERVESDMPILAHRSAKLYFNGTDSGFGSVVSKGTFGVDAKARCTKTPVHDYYGRVVGDTHSTPAPATGCDCGFYALPTDLAPTYQAPGYVTLMVELSGTVIEHEKGYRAEHQRVVECQLPPCLYCGREADLLVVQSFEFEQATCYRHRPADEPGVVVIYVEDLSLPVPVTRQGRKDAHSESAGQ